MTMWELLTAHTTASGDAYTMFTNLRMGSDTIAHELAEFDLIDAVGDFEVEAVDSEFIATELQAAFDPETIVTTFVAEEPSNDIDFVIETIILDRAR